MSSQFKTDGQIVEQKLMVNLFNRDFTQEDIDHDRNACVLHYDQEIGKGNAGDRLFGRVAWVSPELKEGTKIPALCSVEIHGVVRFKCAADESLINQVVGVDGKGGLCRIDVVAAGGHMMRGQVIAVDTIAGTCDVWLVSRVGQRDFKSNQVIK